ncbi:uncharacterized protein BO97DRAFT_445707 [Aspergillus homomorphus CBS 101889]|uniref:Uncharacterized protein n=1 Tax=Aspergillus homomorphus (strain CBS 101889) TaxID=1450537 RepID=A0A395HP51_ASPHC|nr:hypothetical protein BO97DRAFT_445707 [Aspergillus homomorphus CBS 101889]RAL09045.1 hypothetical protein BO97DRAFT_445707 [Aspergillus homomorphus CBS 101889]
MNWTGGRLRRHSAIHAKSRKQRFKKQRANNGVALNSDRPAHQSGQSPAQRSREASPAPPSENHHSPSREKDDSHPRQRLDRIRRELLKKPDWAAVAAARPLQIAFPTPDSLARFGKRRKITDSDRNRLGTSGSCSHPVVRHRRGEGSLDEIGAVSQMSLKINGKRVVRRGTSLVRDQPINLSSQSMLLDGDGSMSANQRWLGNSSRSFNGSDVFQDSSLLLDSSKPSVALHPTSSVLEYEYYPEDATRVISKTEREYELPQVEDPQQCSSRSTSSSLELPVARRFTIDEQVDAERDGRLILPLSKPLANTSWGLYDQGEPSTRGCSSLGVEPDSHRRIDRRSPSIPTLDELFWRAERSPQRHESQDYKAASRTSRFLQAERAPSSREGQGPSMKLFGQSVDLDHDHDLSTQALPWGRLTPAAASPSYNLTRSIPRKRPQAAEPTALTSHFKFTNPRLGSRPLAGWRQSTLPRALPASTCPGDHDMRCL